MQLSLSKHASIMLFRMFIQPSSLAPDKPYTANDAIAQEEVTTIIKWLTTKLFGRENQGTPEEKFTFKEWEGRVKERYVRRILEVCEHYKESGKLVTNCEGYNDLTKSLKGEKPVEDSIEE